MDQYRVRLHDLTRYPRAEYWKYLTNLLIWRLRWIDRLPIALKDQSVKQYQSTLGLIFTRICRWNSSAKSINWRVPPAASSLPLVNNKIFGRPSLSAIAEWVNQRLAPTQKFVSLEVSILLTFCQYLKFRARVGYCVHLFAPKEIDCGN